MKFKITPQTLFNELINYLSLGFTFIGHIAYLPSIIFIGIADWLRVDE